MPRPRKQHPPRWLVIVSDEDGPRLFSAHETQEAAESMFVSLDGLTSSTVTLIEVPECEGIVKAEPRQKPRESASAKIATVSAVAAPVHAAPYCVKTDAQIEAETARALERGESVIISGAVFDDDTVLS